MQKKSKLTLILKISSIAYSMTTVLFFMLMNLAAGFVNEGKTDGIYGACILLVNLLIYVELFGYFAILWMVFLYLFRKSRNIRLRQPGLQEDKFPTIPFVISIVFFLIFMSLMSAVLM